MLHSTSQMSISLEQGWKRRAGSVKKTTCDSTDRQSGRRVQACSRSNVSCMSAPSSSSLRHHVEVLTKVRQLRAFIWLRDGPQPRIGCKKDPKTGDLLVVLVAPASGSFEFVRITLPSKMTVDVATAQLSTSEGIATCLFKIAFEDDSASYMWSDSPPLPLDALKTISCLTCEQPLLTSSSTIDEYAIFCNLRHFRHPLQNPVPFTDSFSSTALICCLASIGRT